MPYVLLEGGSQNKQILVLYLFDDHINQPSEMKIIGLKESGDGKEEGVNLIFGEVLALVEKVDKFGKNLNAFFGIYFSIIEAFGFHDGVGFINFNYGILGLFCSRSQILLSRLDECLDHIGITFHGKNIYLFFKTKPTCK